MSCAPDGRQAAGAESDVDTARLALTLSVRNPDLSVLAVFGSHC